MRPVLDILPALILAVLAASGVNAVEGDASKNALARLKGLSPEEKRVLLERLKRWKGMEEEEKVRIRENLQTFRALPKKDRREIEGNLEEWRKKDAEKKGELKKKHDEWKKLPARRKEVLTGRYRLLTGLPAKERERIQNLPPAKRSAELEGLFLVEEVKRLCRNLTAEEREVLKDLPLAAKKNKALTFLKARRAMHLLRMPLELREKVAAMPKKERAQAESKFLRGAYQRDQMITLLLPSRMRAEFKKQPIGSRDEYALAYFRREGENLTKILPARSRREVEKAPESKRPQKLLECLFMRRLQQIQCDLLPSQRRPLKSIPLSKQWEKTQRFLKLNHHRLLAKLPKNMRDEVLALAPNKQAGKVREIVRGELKRTSATNLQRVGIQQLPLLLQWDAVQRLKRKGRAGLQKKETPGRREK